MGDVDQTCGVSTGTADGAVLAAAAEARGCDSGLRSQEVSSSASQRRDTAAEMSASASQSGKMSSSFFFF